MTKFLKLGKMLFNIDKIEAIKYHSYSECIKVFTGKTEFEIDKSIEFEDLLKHPEIKKMITIEIKPRKKKE